MSDPLLLVGRVGRPFGVRGYCRLVNLSDNPGRFVDDVGQSFLLRNPRRNSSFPDRQILLEGIIEQGDSLLLKWSGIDSPEEVRLFSGWEIFWNGPDDWLPDETEGVRINQLIGLRVIDCDTHFQIGTITDFYERPGQDLLCIGTSKGEFLCPFVEYLVPVVNMVDGEVHVRWSVVGTSE